MVFTLIMRNNKICLSKNNVLITLIIFGVIASILILSYRTNTSKNVTNSRAEESESTLAGTSTPTPSNIPLKLEFFTLLYHMDSQVKVLYDALVSNTKSTCGYKGNADKLEVLTPCIAPSICYIFEPSEETSTRRNYCLTKDATLEKPFVGFYFGGVGLNGKLMNENVSISLRTNSDYKFSLNNLGFALDESNGVNNTVTISPDPKVLSVDFKCSDTSAIQNKLLDIRNRKDRNATITGYISINPWRITYNCRYITAGTYTVTANLNITDENGTTNSRTVAYKIVVSD